MLVLSASLLVAVMCISVVAYELSSNIHTRHALIQRVSDKFLFKTPTLKSLVGTFMTEQGASKNDISVRAFHGFT